MESEMTIQEIEAAFDGEWVLVGDPQRDENRQIVGGKVLAHSTDRDELYAAMLALNPKPRSSATFCFKKAPENMVFVL